MRRGLLLALMLLIAMAPTGISAGPTSPGFRLRPIDSSQILDSKELIGTKIVVLRFQASYCKPCVRESAAFGRLVTRYRARGVEFVAVHVQDTLADTRRFMRTNKVNYPIALDPKLAIGNQFGFKGTPYTVVVDRQGELAAQLHGESAVNRLPRILDRLLAKPPPDRS